MGGLDWVAFPIACDALGVRDPERILAGLVAIRDWFAERERERQEAERLEAVRRGIRETDGL